MKAFSGIFFPIAVTAAVAAGALDPSRVAADHYSGAGDYAWEYSEMQDTVLYPSNGYKLHRIGNLEEIAASDSLYANIRTFAFDTTPHLSARDTIKVPDSLRITDPFRFKYYIALVDSLTHVETRDSLKKSMTDFFNAKDTIRARLDSCDWRKLDSIYFADSAARAKAAFAAWYSSLSKEERKKYDYEQMVKVKMHEADSIRQIKEDQKDLRDSIVAATPRILETYAFPDSMYYKRLVTWSVNPDFHEMKPEEPDTSFNYYFYDYAFRRKDVNSTWLGVAGSPEQPYDFFKRTSDSGVDFWTPNEAWSFSPKTLKQYNTKTPYTELAYWGTLFATSSKESDNIHFLTTQNILPELNMRIQYDRWGGEGILDRENTANKNFVASTNYLGKKYMMNAGFIHSQVLRDENGGIVQTDKEGRDGNFWIRDTTIDAREVPISLSKASSKARQNTVFLEQQLRIPFNFIENLRARKDSTYVVNDSTLNRDITTAFIGHSSEYSAYARSYDDQITDNDLFGKAVYTGPDGTYSTAYGNNSADSLRTNILDNKIFIKLQPWAEDGIISNLNAGVGDRARWHFLQDGASGRKIGSMESRNSFYLYAGASGRFKKYISWNAKGNYVLFGNEAADFKIEANAKFNLYPFRRERNSPLSIGAHFETSLLTPDFYQQHFRSNHLSWDNDFNKISTTKIEGNIDIPYWKLYGHVGYALLANNIYYDPYGYARQNGTAMSVLSASLRKDFVLARIIHLDNSLIFQASSDQSVVPVPTLAGNLRWYVQFVAAKDRDTRTRTVLTMQIGANILCNTPWYAPGWNPNTGTFVNQNVEKYTNGPLIDVFVNMQWKKACIFVKFENLGKGWPMNKKDYFSAHHFINSPASLKFGILWPFYIMPGKAHDHDHGGGQGGKADSGGGIGGAGGGSSARGGFKQTNDFQR